MRKLILILALFVIPAFAFAQHPSSDAPNDVAHGSEKAAHEQAHPTEEHGEGHAAPKTYFGIPGWILKLANMILFIGVLAYLVKGPAKAAFAARSEQIRREAQEARERRAKADQLAADIQARLTQIETEVRAIHERAQAEGERQKRELIAAAETEAAKILANARNEVDNRLKYARHELTEYAGQLAAERAEAILREKITPADQQKLFSESVREVGEVNA
jgi:F-type H+-transporting ATPase subunit b